MIATAIQSVRRGRKDTSDIAISPRTAFRFFRSDQRVDLSPAIHDQDRTRSHDRGRKEEMKHSPTTVMAGDQPKSKAKKKKRFRFAWKVFGLSPCTKECGGGTIFVN